MRRPGHPVRHSPEYSGKSDHPASWNHHFLQHACRTVCNKRDLTDPGNRTFCFCHGHHRRRSPGKIYESFPEKEDQTNDRRRRNFCISNVLPCSSENGHGRRSHKCNSHASRRCQRVRTDCFCNRRRHGYQPGDKIFIKNFRENCNKIQIKKISKGETVTSYIEKRNQICIIINGEVDLIRYDVNGNKTIIGRFNENDVFGEVFYPANTNNELFAVAKKNSEILYFTYDTLFAKCECTCSFHKELINNLSELFLDEIIRLNLRVELLTKRNTRDKLLSYFDILSKSSMRKTFTLPYNYTDLADFLSVDRSAMMRELKLLIDEGFVEKNGSKITLLY